MACGHKAAARDVPAVLLLLLLLLVVSLATVTRCAWVGDYASDHGCGKTFVEALCDPADAAQNRACSDACHYNGCGGGRCVYVATARGCYCKP
ncbi:hypothetical protein CFC21_059945 [Triticum aestivum]|uniref:Knottin scorpion toxin-like domain-containing protein n=2 Tax=Triticum aestivum TaxID=4565 RepID=A0A3B6J0R5_WHEAT|nr:hypothetical protein CFC21_059945 [Triticum aestivum]